MSPERFAFFALAVTVLTACGPGPVPDAPRTALAHFPAPKLIGTASRFTLQYDTAPGCLKLPTGVKITVNDRPAKVVDEGEYTRQECGGDCQQEGGNGKILCVVPAFSTDASGGEPIDIRIEDGTTTFRATFRGDDGLVLFSPTRRPLTTDDDVMLGTTLPAASVLDARLTHLDGSAVTGLYFDAPTQTTMAGTLGYHLRSGDCSDGGTTLDAALALDVSMPNDACEGGLVACRLTGRTRALAVRLAFPKDVGCR
jgi:hypothetical protein